MMWRILIGGNGCRRPALLVEGRLRRLRLGRVGFDKTAHRSYLHYKMKMILLLLMRRWRKLEYSSPSPERWWRTTTTPARRRKCLWLSWPRARLDSTSG